MTLRALVAYPLSRDFQDALAQKFTVPIHYCLISELRKQPWSKLVRTLRGWRGQLIVPLEETQSEVLLPILLLIASLTGCQQKNIVYSDHAIKRISSFAAVKAFFGLAYASVKIRLNYWRTAVELKKITLLPFAALKLNHQANHVLYINGNLWFGIKAGGSVGHIAGVANALVGQGLAVDYLAVERNALLGADIHFTAVKPPSQFGLPFELNHYDFNRSLVRQSKKINKPLQFIYQRLSIANYAGVVAAHYHKVPLVIEYNGSEVWIAKHWGRGLRFSDLAIAAENACLNHAAVIVTVSAVLKDELIGRGIPAHKIVCYPNGIDPLTFDPARYSLAMRYELRQRYDIAADALVLSFVGTFGAWHGVEVLAQAIVELIDHYQEWLNENKVRFLLVGDGAKMAEVKAILQQCAYENYVRFTGLIPQHQAPLYLASADILLSPHIKNPDGSRFFGSPTKLFEYMAMGKAIIASNLEQIGAVLENSLLIKAPNSHPPEEESRALSVLCRPGEKQDIVDAILFLGDKPQWRWRLGENARREALAKYTWDHHVEKILDKLTESTQGVSQ